MGKALDLALAQQEARAVAKAAIEPIVAEVPERVKLAAEVWLAAHPPKDGIDGAKGVDGVDGTNGRDGTDGRDGTNGVDGRSIVWRGTWSRTATYEPLSAVEYQGSSYITANPIPAGIRPPTKPWDLMAAKGQDGRTIIANGGRGGSGSGSGSALTVSDEGVSLDTAVTSIDFAGAGVTATNVGHAVTVSIAGGSDYVASASDPGALGPGAIWSRPDGDGGWAQRTRNDADDGWNELATVQVITDGDGDANASHNAFIVGSGNATAASNADVGVAGDATTSITASTVHGVANAEQNAFVSAAVSGDIASVQSGAIVTGDGTADANRHAHVSGDGGAAAIMEAIVENPVTGNAESGIRATAGANDVSVKVYADASGAELRIKDGTGSTGSLGQVLTAQGDDTAIWDDAGGSGLTQAQVLARGLGA